MPEPYKSKKRLPIAKRRQTAKKRQTTFDHEGIKQALVAIAIESWRIANATANREIDILTGHSSRHKSQVNWFIKQVKSSLEEVGLRLVTIAEQVFDPGMAVKPINIQEFKEGDILIVDQMIEPIVMGPEGLIRIGTVILRRAES